MRISNSQVLTFQDCPRKEYWSFRQNLMPLSSNSPEALTRGIVGHNALDAFYQGKIAKVSQHECEEAAYAEVFKGVVKYPNYAATILDLKDRILFHYFKRFPDEGIEIVESESMRVVEADFQGTATNFAFRLDILAKQFLRGKTRLVLWDHKFVKDFWSPTKLNMSPQFPKYLKALQLHGKDVKDVILNQLRYRTDVKDLNKMYRRLTLENVTETHMHNVVTNHVTIAEEIAALHAMPEEVHKQLAIMHNEPYRCDNCWFNNLCQNEIRGLPYKDIIDVMYQQNTYGYNEDESVDFNG